MPSKTGSCLCRGVRYRIDGPLRDVVACHCNQCRKTTGHYGAATQCAASDIEIEADTLAWFQSSEAAERGFCRRCGGNLFWRRLDSDRISIWAGTLDGPTGLKMASQIHVATKGDYYDLPNCGVVDQSTLA